MAVFTKESKMEWQSKANWKDPNWKYVRAEKTDIAKTFARIKREMEQLKNPQSQTVVAMKKIGVK